LPDAPGLDAPAADDALSEAIARPAVRADMRPSGPAARATQGGPSLIRSSMVVSSLTLVSRVMGFARDVAVSYTMGASHGYAADAYNTALAFPNLFRRIFAEGAFAAAFGRGGSRRPAGRRRHGGAGGGHHRPDPPRPTCDALADVRDRPGVRP
jgi:hypothetical protein